MFSIHTIKSGVREKENYYTQDESLSQSKDKYYAQQQSENKQEEQELDNSYDSSLTTAQFYGKGAAKLGLEGAVSQEEFKSLFYGYKPGTEERIRGQRQNSKTQENLAEDIVLSPSKSFSIAYHQGGDKRLFNAHVETVKEIADVIESKYIQTREYAQGQHRRVNTGNMISALIPHHTSRDGDMQIHHHLVIFNGTERGDGKYCAMKNVNLNRQKWLGHLYQSLLAQKVQKLGYSIRQTKDGFELEGISREQIEVFSKRSRSIVKSIKKQGKEVTPENRDAATLTTRKAKNHTRTLEEYQQQWREAAESHGIKAPIPSNKPVKPQHKQQTAKEALHSAIAHLSERSVSFREDKIYEYVYQSGLQSFSLGELQQQIQTDRELIRLGGDATQFTTAKALKRELDTARQWLKGQNQATPLLDDPHIEGTKLNRGQAEAVRRTLASTDKHQIIHGLSGVGKTTALGILRNQLRGTDVSVRGFAPTIEAAKKLQQELDIKTHTVARLALATPEDKPNQLWIIDEAGLMSANQATAILQKAESVGARILLVGDKGQNSSVEAGSPLRSLINHGATVHSISEIIRQQNSEQKEAVELISQGQGGEALQLLEDKGYVTQIEDRQERTVAVAQEYLKLSDKERTQTLLVTGTNKERRAITSEIRKGLQAEGKIGKSIETVQLASRNLSREQQSKISNYRVGDYIQLNLDYKRSSLKKGQLYKVEKIQGRELVVSSSKGRLYRFDPSNCKQKQVFNSRQIEIAVGDKLRWTAGSDKKKGQINGKQVTVRAIDNLSITVEDSKGEQQQVSLLQPMPLDHNLVSTSYRAQGKSKKRVIVSATNDPTSSQESFYVEISRQVEHLKVYAEDIGQLRQWVQRSNAQQNPIELIEQHYGRKTRSNTSTPQRTAAGNQRNQRAEPSNPGAERSANSERPQPVHSRTERASATEEKQRSERTDREAGREHAVATERYRELEDSLPARGRIVLQGLDGLADAITQTNKESELVEVLQQTQDTIKDFDRTLQLQKLDLLDKALEKEPSVKSPAPEEKPSIRGLDELADAITQTNKENELVEVLQQTLNITTEFDRAATLRNRQLQTDNADKATEIEPSIKGLDELADAITQTNEENELVEVLQQTLNITTKFDRSRQLQRSNTNHKDEKPKSSVELSGLEELSDAVAAHSSSEAIAEAMTVFHRISDSLEEQLHHKLSLISDALSKHQAAISNSPHLQNVVSEINSRKGERAFWQPNYGSDSKPIHIEQHHWEEFKQSAIHPDLASLNAISLKGYTPHEYLLYDLPREDRLNTGAIRSGLMRRYAHLEDGGWWGSAGVDIQSLQNIQAGEKPEESPWGCFKPDSPYLDSKKTEERGKTKHIKYETPPKTERVPFLPNVSPELAEKIYQKHGINPTAAERESGFWYVVKQYPKQIPITITEGFKKTLSSLSQGEVTIGLSGVNHIYKSYKDGEKLVERELNPQVAVFAHPTREFRMAYDQDTKVKTIVNVRRDLVRGIELLEATGSTVKVLKWNPEEGKGLDDLISQAGPLAYAEAQKGAASSSIDKQIHYRTEYNKLSNKARAALGEIGENRLNLEVFIAAVLKGDKQDGQRVISESDKVRSLKREKPHLVDSYIYAMKKVAGTYLNMASSNTPDLDSAADKMVRQQMAKHQVALQGSRASRSQSSELKVEPEMER